MMMRIRVPRPMYTSPPLPGSLDEAVRPRSFPAANLGAGHGFRPPGPGNIPAMITFFVILAVLMVLVVAAGQWSARPGRRVLYDRDVVVDRRPDVVEEIVEDDPYPVATRSRRVVRRRRTY